jgi:hypothetical protein
MFCESIVARPENDRIITFRFTYLFDQPKDRQSFELKRLSLSYLVGVHLSQDKVFPLFSTDRFEEQT